MSLDESGVYQRPAILARRFEELDDEEARKHMVRLEGILDLLCVAGAVKVCQVEGMGLLLDFVAGEKSPKAIAAGDALRGIQLDE